MTDVMSSMEENGAGVRDGLFKLKEDFSEGGMLSRDLSQGRELTLMTAGGETFQERQQQEQMLRQKVAGMLRSSRERPGGRGGEGEGW